MCAYSIKKPGFWQKPGFCAFWARYGMKSPTNSKYP